MKDGFLKRLETEVLIHFGSVTTELGKRGFTLGESNIKFMVEQPQIFQEVMKSFYDAGSNVGSANTGGANRLRLREYGLEDRVREFNIKAAKLAREVTPANCYLEGIVSVTGHFLKPAGDVTFDEVYEVYKEQITALVEGGVDMIRVTGHDLEEMKAGLKAARDVADLPVVALVTFNPTARGYRTMSGLDTKTAARELDIARADVIGTICGKTGMEDTTNILKEMRSVTAKPLLAKPNAGTPEVVSGQPVHPVTPELMAREVPSWIAAGARIVGGCCGTGPEHIARIAAAARGKTKKA